LNDGKRKSEEIKMSVDREEIRKIGELARIELSEVEVAKFAEQVSEVVEFNVQKLSEITQDFDQGHELRSASEILGQEDISRPSLDQDLALSNAEKTENGFVVVPKILE
jgi:aspartyl-tRNA(Asn)/glutamyl-tRNA(Gln) amidotransferase subunit C